MPNVTPPSQGGINTISITGGGRFTCQSAGVNNWAWAGGNDWHKDPHQVSAGNLDNASNPAPGFSAVNPLIPAAGIIRSGHLFWSTAAGTMTGSILLQLCSRADGSTTKQAVVPVFREDFTAGGYNSPGVNLADYTPDVACNVGDGLVMFARGTVLPTTTFINWVVNIELT